MCLFVLCLAVTGLGQGTGTIRYEVWEGIGGTAVTDLTGNANFPDNPSWDDEVTLFETPTDRADNFGGRLYGWLHPDTSGDYTFWLAADDGADVWLSTTDDPADAVLIVSEDSWGGSRDWLDRGQSSSPITLDAGGKYYIEALYKEGGGGDNLAVAWQLNAAADPNAAIEVIDGAFLSPAPQNPNVLKARNVGPADGAVEVGLDAMLEWTAGPTATSHRVFLSTDAVIDEADLIAETTDTNAVPMLEAGMTYYWRVNEVDADGEMEGYVWSFTVISDQAHFPSPADGGLWSLGIDTELSWTPGVGALAHNVYLSADKALVDARDASVAATFWLMDTFIPGDLEAGTTYYWAVDEFAPPLTIAGPTWSFGVFAFDPIAITDPSLALYYTFDEIQGGLIDDKSGHKNFGVVTGDSPDIMIVNDPDMGAVLSLPGGSNQSVAALAPTGISGNDLTTIACWAKADSTSIPDWTLIFGFTGQEDGSGGSGSHFNIGSLGGPGGIGAHCWGWEETMVDDANGLDWHHYAMTYDGTTIAYFLDGVAIDSDPNKSNVQDLSARADRVQIGSRITQDSSFPGDVDDCRVYNRVLSQEEILWAMNNLADVTGANDIVQGSPNDGDWPGGEYPALMIDDDINTKFLHFGGETGPTGIQVAPAVGPTLVTGLTFTTANDSPPRDPITYELYGSNESIDGPYELIASGDIVDFNQVDEYPRFTKNATAIVIDNAVVYAYYQVLFPTVRDAANANSMQIAEVELIGQVIRNPLIAWVSFHTDVNHGPNDDAAGAGFTEAPDKAYTDLLKANGYDVIRTGTSKMPDVDLLNSADLVITSRSVNSGDYSGDGATVWNGITTPMIIVGGYPLRNSRMGYTTGGTMVDTVGDINLAVADSSHPIFAGIDLVDGVMANPFAGVVNYPTDGTLARGVSVNTNEVNAEGTVLATVANVDDPTVGGMVIGEWQAGATLTHDGGAGTDMLAGHRLVFLTGAREASGISSRTAGLYDLYEDGATMLLNAVEYMLQ